MDTRSILKGLDLIVDVLAIVNPEVGELAREGVLFAKELVEQGAEDPVTQMRNLRARVRDDWRQALAERFNPGG
jgi:hypothetical protein